MSRAAALFVVLALSAGPNVSWVCTVLCDEAPVASGCHETPAGAVLSAAANCCEIAADSAGGFVPGAVRQSGISLDNHSASLMPYSTYGDSLTRDRQGTRQQPVPAQTPHSRPVALRL